jgi:tRNA-specific 2-thiouridylase
LKAKFRYRSADVDVSITKIDDAILKVTFHKPQKAIATGQAAVFYHEDILVGGGVISEVYRDNKRIDI